MNWYYIFSWQQILINVDKEENAHRILLHRLAKLYLRLSGFYPLSQRLINQLYTPSSNYRV